MTTTESTFKNNELGKMLEELKSIFANKFYRGKIFIDKESIDGKLILYNFLEEVGHIKDFAPEQKIGLFAVCIKNISTNNLGVNLQITGFLYGCEKAKIKEIVNDFKMKHLV